jgi:hypothetical protein
MRTFRILFLILLVSTVKAFAMVSYQCPVTIDKKNENGWELVKGKEATGGIQYAGPVRTLITSSKSYYDFEPPDDADDEAASVPGTSVFTVVPEKFPAWVMCAYPNVEAAYFKQIHGNFTKCTVWFDKKPDVMVCE